MGRLVVTSSTETRQDPSFKYFTSLQSHRNVIYLVTTRPVRPSPTFSLCTCNVISILLCNATSYGPLVLVRGNHGAFIPASLSSCLYVFVSGGAATFPRPPRSPVKSNGMSQNHGPCGVLSVSGDMILLAARGNTAGASSPTICASHQRE